MTRIQALLGVSALVAIAGAALYLQSASPTGVTARFWFDDVTYALPGARSLLGRPLSAREQRAIEQRARAELAEAFEGLALRLSDAPDAPFRIRVRQAFPPGREWRRFAVAQSVSMGAFGGDGAISFVAVASRALGYAPPRATRARKVAAIGRGLGRIAAHELAHQLLHAVDLHVSDDANAYEFRHANRAELYYEPIHWAFTHALLLDRLGPSLPAPKRVSVAR